MLVRPVKLLHTADIHLDAPFRWLGSKGKEQRRQLKETFRALIDLALKEQVDALLIAGDLFDSNSPSQDAIDLVQAQLRRLSAPVFLLPGTHDCLDDSSIYRKSDLFGPGVHIFDHSNSAFELDALDLTVHGQANLTKRSRTSPLATLKRSPRTRFNVALAHGSLALPGAEDDFPLTREEIVASGMDYVALGHWHSYRDCSASTTRAFYSGPPELLAEGEMGCALLVEIDEAGTKVEPRRIGRRRYQELELALDQFGSLEEVRVRIRSAADADLALSVSFTGLRPLHLVVDAVELSQEMAADFFALKIKDNSHPALSPEDTEAFPEELVIGQFVKRMKALIAEAESPEQQRLRESALQIGVALLQGKKVL